MVGKFEFIAGIVQYLSLWTIGHGGGGGRVGTSEVVGLTGTILPSEAWTGLWVRALQPSLGAWVAERMLRAKAAS